MITIFKTKNKSTQEMGTEEFEQIFKTYWEKSTKSLIASTPKGKIRFTLLDLTKLKEKIKKKANLPDFEKLFSYNITKYSTSKNFYSTYSFQSFPPYEEEANTMSISFAYQSTPRYEVLLLFYYNNSENISNVGKELITHWFENCVLPSFKKFKSMPVRDDLPLLARPLVKTYSYHPIHQALLYFDCGLSEGDCNSIVYELSSSHYGILFPRIRRFHLESNYCFTVC